MPHRINIEVGTMANGKRHSPQKQQNQHTATKSDIWPKTVRQVLLLNFYPQCRKVASCRVVVPRALHAKQQTASRRTAPGQRATEREEERGKERERNGSELVASIKHKQDNKFISIICYIISRPPSLSLFFSPSPALARFDFKICYKLEIVSKFCDSKE